MAGDYVGSMPGGLSGDTYLDRRLRPLDSEHYSAAGLVPYRLRESAVELLLPKEKPWNSFTQGWDPVAWNIFGGKRVPRLERSVETTAVRSFMEIVGQADGAPSVDSVYDLLARFFAVWYPMGKYGVLFMEVTDDSLDDLPDRYAAWKQQAGPDREFRILPSGQKKWAKHVDEVGWVPAHLLLEKQAQVSDLFGSILKIAKVRELLKGAFDPEKELPEPPSEPVPRDFLNVELASESKGKGKGGKGKFGGAKGKGDGKSNQHHMYQGGFAGSYMKAPMGCGGGGCMGKGMAGMPNMAGGMPSMPCLPNVMYPAAAARGMPMMPMMPMSFPGPALGGFQANQPLAGPMQHSDQNSAEMQRQMYGEQLYLMVQPMAPNAYLAQKITGMLLELPQNELLLNLTNTEELQRRVVEALEVLQEDGVA